ncbi:MAG: glutamate racemase [Candidatus Dadabacteria bacterium]|nr:MAG: glutamate racemase [Candidatus Dadabacteria bacterium]
MSAFRNIGIFDSGVGGLTVLAAARAACPGTQFVYLGDTARVPYGSKSATVVRRYAREIAHYLTKARAVDALVVACNSASAAAIDVLRQECPVPVYDVIAPGAGAAVAQTRTGKIGVLATRGTVRSQAYVREIHRLDPHAEVTQVACPLFVPLAEEGWTTGPIPQTIALEYVRPLIEANCDTVILGCTHYPLLRDAIANAICVEVNLVDSAQPLAASLADRAATGSGRLDILTTDDPERFRELGDRFLGETCPEPELVPIEVLAEPEAIS